MKKHTIKADGAPFDEDGQPLNESKSTAGEGRALCSCGWVSETFQTRAARKEEHAAHKTMEDRAAADAAAQEQADWDAADPKAASAEKGVEDLLGLDDEPSDSIPTRVDYTSGRFWDTLGTGSVAVVQALGGTAQAVKESRRETYLLVDGPEPVQERASTLLPQLWRDAQDALTDTRRQEDKADRSVFKNRERIWLENQQFMTEFIAGAVSAVIGKRSARNPSKGYLAGRMSVQGI